MPASAKKHPLIWLLGAYIVTFIADWLIQLSYYLYMTSQNPRVFEGVKTLFDYRSGVIGDGVVLPIINTVIMFIFLSYAFRLNKKEWWVIALLGVAGDFGMHATQGALKLTNWSMPQPFQWNFVSQWHMVSLFFQLSYLFLFFWIFIKYHRDIARQPVINAASLLVFGLLVFFVYLFVRDYHFLFHI